jgi:alpha-glucosidase
MWSRDAVVYQIYPRSFQDSDGDGIGDLRGVAERLDHVAWLGAQAVWLSPFFPSPQADTGYDVSDYTGVDPAYGTLEDADALVEAAHERGLKVLLDLVPCHTSIEHPWFREHPDRYVWSDRDGPHNNWHAAFGGPAWSRDAVSGRWYLHSFYPQQPDLDWRNPEVPEAVAGVLRFWRARGVDGFRLDALDRIAKDPELRDDPPASAAPPLPVHADLAALDAVHSRASVDPAPMLRALRGGAGAEAFLVGEVYLPTARLGPWLGELDAVFCFELLHAPWRAGAVRSAIVAALDARPEGSPDDAAGRVAWVLSNHDFPRVPARVGPANVRAAAMLLLTLPGRAFVYQGDEIGMGDGPGGATPFDRHGRDVHRHPMQWDAGPAGGFTAGAPWLPVVDADERNVADQRADPASLLSLYRALIALRPRLGARLELAEADPGVIAYRRGDHLVAVSLAEDERPAPAAGALVLATHPGLGKPGAAAPRTLPPGGGFVASTT